MKIKLFVYGTLMKRMINHHFLESSKFLGNTEINGYDMYLLGYYPGIVPGKGIVKGEVYEIDDNTLNHIDYLEGEGNLYLRKIADTDFGQVFIYVYNYDINSCPQIPYEMQPYNDLIYYVSYGSNILEERFKNYIQGGTCRFNNKTYRPCINTHLPIKIKNTIIPYRMYFSRNSSLWNGSSVCFLDYSQKGSSYGRAYLITKEQFNEIQQKEGISWYGKILQLEDIEGFKAYTFTNEKILEHKSFESIKEEYLNVIIMGLKESYNLSKKEIMDYINNSCS